MTARRGGQYVVTAPTEDPDRPVRGEAPNDPLFAVATWNAGVSDLTPGQGGTTIATASLLLDFEAAFFREAGVGLPKRYDRFELPNQSEGNQLVEVARVNEDGSAHVLCWCTVIRA